MILRACHTCGKLTPHAHCPAHRHEHRSPSSRETGTRQWQTIRRRILERDGHACTYCGQPADQVDHVKPVSKGGSSSTDQQLVAACRTCNARKGDRPAPQGQGADPLREWTEAGMGAVARAGSPRHGAGVSP